MYFVTLGTIHYPYTRIVDWVKKLLKNEMINEPVFLQYGSTQVSDFEHPLLTKIHSLKKSEMIDLAKQSKLVISHAGQGSTRMLTNLGLSFILVPRQKEFGEHVDNHQLLFARAVTEYGIPYCLELEQLIYFINQPPLPCNKDFLDRPLLSSYLKEKYSQDSKS